MKIQGDRPSGVQDAGQATQVDKAAQQRAPHGRGGVDGGDRVEVSADARLLGRAVDSAGRRRPRQGQAGRGRDRQRSRPTRRPPDRQPLVEVGRGSPRPECGAWGVTEASRLSTTAQALGLALEALGDALAQVRHESIVVSEALIDVRVRAFRAAAADAVASGDTLDPDEARGVSEALSRCRRLGSSLAMLTGDRSSFPDSPRGYTPVGRPLSHADEGSYVTARG
jgi:hypothetical protein